MSKTISRKNQAAISVPQINAMALPEFGNDGLGVILPDTGRGYRDGALYFANDSMFTETTYSEPLTNYTVGWRDPNNIEETVQFFAPAVPVNRRFEWKQAVNAEEFVSETIDDQRAIGADFKRVKYSASDVTDKTINRGLTYIADLDNVTGANWQNQKVEKLLRRILRNRLRRAIAAINAASVQQAYTWDTSAGKNPDQDVRVELNNATNISGIRPNRVAYGDAAWLKRLNSYGANNNPAGYLGFTADPFKTVETGLLVDKIRICKERYQSSNTAKSEILGSNVYCFYAMDGIDVEDPSNIKCFVTPFSEEQGGGLWRVYVQQISSKLVAITVECYEKIVITYAGAIRQLVIS